MVVDVLIIGGGLVGASLAAALKPSGLSLALVETQPEPPRQDGWDSRIYAISPGNMAFLNDCGAGLYMDRSRMSSVDRMRVFGDTGSELEFSAYQMGVPELSVILESRQIQHALWQILQQQDLVSLFHPARCADLAIEEEYAVLELEDGRKIKARLVVGADGRDSWIRSQSGIIEPPTLYQQNGVVANFVATEPHRGSAFQWFQPDGILALLPLPDRMVSMVWSVSPDKSDRLLQLQPGELCAQVAAAAQGMLGELDLITPAAAFPLRLLHLPKIVKPRLALVGDAAHNLHPLAGQGVNLGFRDVRQLAATLMQRGPQPDCGDLRLLRRYERARQEDIVTMQAVTDMLKKLFVNDNPLLRKARNLGLAATNRVAPLKKALMRHALN